MKIFVTGGTGMVGSNIIKLAQDKHKADIVAAFYRRQPPVQWGCETVEMNLENSDSVRRAIELHRPDVVIHCAVPRDLLRMEFDHPWSWNILVTATRVLAETCRDVGARLIFVSTDYVFGNGGEPPYSEDSPPCPLNYYGFMKAIGETLVSSICPNSAVARAAAVFGVSLAGPVQEAKQGTGHGGAIVDYCLYRLSRGRPALIWTDYVNTFANPSLVTDVADAILTIAHGEHRGTFHCCGRDGVSRLELAWVLAEVFGYDPRLIRVATPQEIARELDIASERPVPRDSRLSVASTQARLGRTQLGLRKAVVEFRRQLGNAVPEVRACVLNQPL